MPACFRFSRRHRTSLLSIVAVCIAAASGVVGAAVDLRLIQAVKNKDIQAVRMLVKQRIDVNSPQGDGSTALHWAARIDDLAIADDADPRGCSRRRCQ